MWRYGVSRLGPWEKIPLFEMYMKVSGGEVMVICIFSLCCTYYQAVQEGWGMYISYLYWAF